MTKRVKKKKKVSNLIIVLLLLVVILAIFNIASNNFVKDNIEDKVNLIIDNINVTAELKQNIYLENGIIYLSKEDILNFFDDTIIYDENYNHIITRSENKVASLPIGENEIKVNSSTMKIEATVIQKDDIYYVPFSKLEDVYNVSTTYIEDTNIVTVDFLDKEHTIATVNKEVNIKLKPTNISRTVTQVEKGETLVIANNSDISIPNGWTRVRTEKGVLGYIKTNKMGKWNIIREEIEKKTETEEVNILSPAFFELEKDGDISENISSQDKEDIKLAHNQGNKVYPVLSNEKLQDTTSEILKDYELREKVINKILDYIIIYKLDGIKIEFRNIYEENESYFSRLIIELEPRLNEIGAELIVIK